jgi:hypothetical protein
MVACVTAGLIAPGVQAGAGYREAADLCQEHGLHPDELTGPGGRLWRHELACRIHQADLDYARLRRAALADALPALHDIAEEIQWCEI